MIELFADKAKQIFSIDHSPCGVLRGLAKVGIINVELRAGIINGRDLLSKSADTATLHQVLHCALYPAAVVTASSLLTLRHIMTLRNSIATMLIPIDEEILALLASTLWIGLPTRTHLGVVK